MDHPPNGGFLFMIIWKGNISIPDSLKSLIFKRIEDNHIDKKKFYTSYLGGFGSTTFSDILVPFYGDIIDGIMKDLGMYKRSRYYYNLWVQMYNSETDTHGAHSHFGGTEIISFTHVLNCSEQKCFYFLDNDDNKIYPEHQSKGDMFAWPAWMLHGVDNVKDESLNRLVISGNISLKDYYGGNMDTSVTSHDDGSGHVTWDVIE